MVWFPSLSFFGTSEELYKSVVIYKNKDVIKQVSTCTMYPTYVHVCNFLCHCIGLVKVW